MGLTYKKISGKIKECGIFVCSISFKSTAFSREFKNYPENQKMRNLRFEMGRGKDLDPIRQTRDTELRSDLKKIVLTFFLNN